MAERALSYDNFMKDLPRDKPNKRLKGTDHGSLTFITIGIKDERLVYLPETRRRKFPQFRNHPSLVGKSRYCIQKRNRPEL